MADKKISTLTGAATPLAGTEVLPIVQSGTTVKVATNDLTVRNIRANATTGILQVTGPAAASTRVATVPDANFTVARTDAAQTFTGNQRINGFLGVDVASASWSAGSAIDLGLGTAIFNPNSTGQTWFYTNAYFNAGAKYKNAGEATWYQQVAGAHNWYGSAAGAAPDDPITFVQTGGLDNSGNMAVTGNFVFSTAGKGITDSTGATTMTFSATKVDLNKDLMFPNSTGIRGSGNDIIVMCPAAGIFYHQLGAGSYYTVTTSGGSTSDASLKTNVQQLSGALDKVCQLRGVNFEFIEHPFSTSDQGTQIGVIAQEVETQYPEIVVTNEDGIKSVRYDRLVVPLIEAIKELKAELDAVKVEIAALKAQ
jgi:hypothetical protein